MQSVVDTIVQCSEELQSQRNTINNLNMQVTKDDSDFNDIYEAIVDKGQHPIRDDRSTYAGAIENISGGGSTPVLQSKTVNPTQNTQYVRADAGYDGLELVNILGVDHNIDPQIKAENIKKNINILGIIGTYEGEGGGGDTRTYEFDGEYADKSPVTYEWVIDDIVNEFVINNPLTGTWNDATKSNVKIEIKQMEDGDYLVYNNWTVVNEGGGSGDRYYTITAHPNTNIYSMRITFTNVFRVTAHCVVTSNFKTYYGTELPESTAGFNDGDYFHVRKELFINNDVVRYVYEQYVVMNGEWIKEEVEPASDKVFYESAQALTAPATSVSQAYLGRASLCSYMDKIYSVDLRGVSVYDENTDSWNSVYTSASDLPHETNNNKRAWHSVDGMLCTLKANSNGTLTYLHKIDTMSGNYSQDAVANSGGFFRSICTDNTYLYSYNTNNKCIDKYDIWSNTREALVTNVTVNLLQIIYYDGCIYGLADNSSVYKINLDTKEIAEIYKIDTGTSGVEFVETVDGFYMIGGGTARSRVLYCDGETVNAVYFFSDDHNGGACAIANGIMYEFRNNNNNTFSKLGYNLGVDETMYIIPSAEMQEIEIPAGKKRIVVYGIM